MKHCGPQHLSSVAQLSSPRSVVVAQRIQAYLLRSAFKKGAVDFHFFLSPLAFILCVRKRVAQTAHRSTLATNVSILHSSPKPQPVSDDGHSHPSLPLLSVPELPSKKRSLDIALLHSCIATYVHRAQFPSFFIPRS